MHGRWRGVVLVAVLVALTWSRDPDVEAAPPSPEAWDFVESINAERFGAGLPALSVLTPILDMATSQANAIAQAGRLFHNDRLAADVAARVPGWARVGENVGYGGSVGSVHRALMESPPHRANILGDYSYVAVSVVPRNGTLWVAQVFVKAPPGLTMLTRVPVQRSTAPSDVLASVAASRAVFAAGTADAVVVARRDVFADALTGGALAAVRRGPVLLSDSAAASAEVVAEARRVVRPAGTVYLMGGTSALSDTVERAFRDAGLSPMRIAGASRFDTAVLTADQVNANPSVILIASGTSFADAMSATPVAGRVRAPILLVDGDTVPPATLQYLALHPLAERIVIGGTAGVGQGAATLALSTDRVAGPDRYATSAAIAQRWFAGTSSLVTANGTVFQDAAIGGPIAAHLGAPVLLTAAVPTRPTYDAVHGMLRGLRDVRVLASDAELPLSSISLLFS